MWMVSLLAYALPSTMLMYAVGALAVYKLRLTKTTKIAGFFIAWLITAIVALLIADEATILSAEQKIFPAAAIGAIIAFSGIALYVSAVPAPSHVANTLPRENRGTTETPAVVDEDRIYAAIANELEVGASDKGLWTRLFAECGGDENQTKVLYIKQRASRLISAEHSRLELTAREQAAEAARLEELRL